MPIEPLPADPSLVRQPLTYRQARLLETPGRLRGPTYRRPTWNVYLATSGQATSDQVTDTPISDAQTTASLATDHGDAIRVFRAAVGPDAVLGGPSGAWAFGVRLAAGKDPVEIVLPPGKRVRQREGLRVRGADLAPGEIVPTRFGLATSPARTAFDLARRGHPDQALAWVDAVLRGTAATNAELQAVIDRHPHTRGVRQARVLAALADSRAESPPESRLRWILHDAGLPPPTPQLVVRDGYGRFVARLDLGWEALKVGAEYDGAQHRERDQHGRDLARHNLLRALGWQVVQIDANQLRHPDRVIALLRALLR